MTRRVINDKKGQDRLPSAHHYYNTLNTYEGAKGRRKKEEGHHLFIYISMQRSRVEETVICSSWREEELMPTYDTPVNSGRGLIIGEILQHLVSRE
jgi:hypothetical protein